MKESIKLEIRDLLKKKNYLYHVLWDIISIITGCIFVFIECINKNGVSAGIFLAILGIVVGTLSFCILPIFFIALGTLIKYIPTIAFPMYVIFLIGSFFEENILTEYGYFLPLFISLLLSLFGYINIKTRILAEKEVN